MQNLKNKHRIEILKFLVTPEKDGKILSVRDYISKGLHMVTCGEYDADIKIIKNSEDDILDVVREAYETNFLKKANNESNLVNYN